jgi:hypothetical protein
MNCDEAKGRLNSLYDGELSGSERELVAQHVEHCPGCAGELAALAQLDRASRQLRALEPPPELWDRIAEQLASGRARPVERGRVVTRRRFVLAAGIVAASAVGGLLGSSLVRRRRADGTPGIQQLSGGVGSIDTILVNLSLLPPDDRRLAEAQETCAADNCEMRLGTEGQPLKIVLRDTPVFCCSHECESWVRAHPDAAVAKARTLVQQHRPGHNQQNRSGGAAP